MVIDRRSSLRRRAALTSAGMASRMAAPLLPTRTRDLDCDRCYGLGIVNRIDDLQWSKWASCKLTFMTRSG